MSPVSLNRDKSNVSSVESVDILRRKVKKQASCVFKVIKKMQALVVLALQKKKLRIAVKPSKAAKEKRITAKKMTGEKKALRQQKFT